MLCLPFRLRPGGWWSWFWRWRHWAGLRRGSIQTGGPYFCYPAMTYRNLVWSTEMTIRQHGPELYLNMLCLPWFLLFGVSLRFIVALQPAAVSLQLGPHFGGTEHGCFVPLWDTNMHMEHSHTSHLKDIAACSINTSLSTSSWYQAACSGWDTQHNEPLVFSTKAGQRQKLCQESDMETSSYWTKCIIWHSGQISEPAYLLTCLCFEGSGQATCKISRQRLHYMKISRLQESYYDSWFQKVPSHAALTPNKENILSKESLCHALDMQMILSYHFENKYFWLKYEWIYTHTYIQPHHLNRNIYLHRITYLFGPTLFPYTQIRTSWWFFRSKSICTEATSHFLWELENKRKTLTLTLTFIWR